jgi:hypothetical protein
VGAPYVMGLQIYLSIGYYSQFWQASFP